MGNADDGTVPGIAVGDKIMVRATSQALTVESIHQGEVKGFDPHTGGSGWFSPDLLLRKAV